MTDMHREEFEQWWKDVGSWLGINKFDARMVWQAAMRYRDEQEKQA